MGWRHRRIRLGTRASVALVLLGLLPTAVTVAAGGPLAPVLAAWTESAADRIVVRKGRREMLLYRDGAVIARFPVSLGFNPVGQKLREGDGRTPEGLYRLDWRHVSAALGPSLHVSYPSRRDRVRARRAGVDPGGGIMVHSLDEGLPWRTVPAVMRAWTKGCIGLRRRHMARVWHAVADGTPIEIRP